MIISVASGKGGTGKTLIATSLALAPGDRNKKIQFLDCDVEEPNAHIFLKPEITQQEMVTIAVPEVILEKCDYCGRCADVCAFKAIAVWGERVMTFSQLCHGCGACSYICPPKAIQEKPQPIGMIELGHFKDNRFVQGRLNIGEAMSPPVIRKVKSYAADRAITIIDAPPGTSCPVITTVKNSDFCLLVTEPTPFGLNDLILAVDTVKELDIPCGVIINRHNGEEGMVERYCQNEGIPVLLTIPLDIEIARQYSRGITLVEGLPQWRQKFVMLYEKIQEIVNERSSNPER